MELRNNKVDKRRAACGHARQLPQSGQRVSKRWRGSRPTAVQIAKERNDLPFRTERAPGSGGFNYGQSVQINRQRKAGAEKRRSEELRSENVV